MLALRSLVAAVAVSLAPAALADTDWSLEAGVGLQSVAVAPVGIGGLGGFGMLAPAWSLGVERRLGDQSWLMLQARGSLLGVQTSAPQQDDAFSTAASASGFLGVRYALLHAGDLSLSTYGGLGSRYAASAAGLGDASARSTSTHFSVETGAVLQYDVTETFHLRATTRLAEAGFSRSRASFEGEESTSSSRFVRAQLAPVLGLGFGF